MPNQTDEAIARYAAEHRALQESIRRSNDLIAESDRLIGTSRKDSARPSEEAPEAMGGPQPSSS